jgi:predicted N-acetyltransferase YhbS
VVRLLRAVYQPYRERFVPTALTQDVAAVASAPGSWLVAEADGEIVGCVKHWSEDGGHTFCFLAVAVTVRGQGIGSRLVDAVVSAASATGAGTILIALRLSLSENVRFFERHGFHYQQPFGGAAHGLFHRVLEPGT